MKSVLMVAPLAIIIFKFLQMVKIAKYLNATVIIITIMDIILCDINITVVTCEH